MAKETEDRVWAQVSFFLTDDPPAVGDFVTPSGVTSVTRTAAGVWDVVLDSGIDSEEEVLSLCAGTFAKINALAFAVVEKTGPTAYTIRAFDALPNPVDVPIGFTVQRVRHTGTP